MPCLIAQVKQQKEKKKADAPILAVFGLPLENQGFLSINESFHYNSHSDKNYREPMQSLTDYSVVQLPASLRNISEKMYFFYVDRL